MRTKDGKIFRLLFVLATVLLGLVCCGPVSHHISGTVTDQTGTGLPGVTLTLAGDSSGSTVTDTNGNYSFRGLDSGKYFVTPSLAGYTFSPAYLEVTVTNRDASGQDFVAISATPATGQLPRTGQTTSYGAGDDGALQEGVVWPSPRFTDNGDGTVTDNLTGLVWLKNANCFVGTVSWIAALTDANGLASGTCGLTDGSAAGEWRLPNREELMSLIDYSQSNPALPSGYPFTGVQSEYWSSTTSAFNAPGAWAVNMPDGVVSSHTKTATDAYVWPVRSGPSSGTVQLPQTGQTTCYDATGNQIVCSGTGQDADKAEGVVWPSPRFTDNGDGTLMDNLTGLVWLQNANCFGTVAWTDALTDANGLANGMCGLVDGSTAGQWRLPNVRELDSLINADQSNLSTWLTPQGFSNVVTVGNYWSSTTSAGTTGDAWSLGAASGNWDYYNKINSSPISNYVWPVRSGPQ